MIIINQQLKKNTKTHKTHAWAIFLMDCRKKTQNHNLEATVQKNTKTHKTHAGAIFLMD